MRLVLWDLVAVPWSLSLELFRRFDGEPSARGAAGEPGVRRSCRVAPLDLLLDTLDTGASSAARLLPAGDFGLLELRNKVRAFACFRLGAGAAAGAATGAPLDPYRGLWAEEGAGFAHAEPTPAGSAEFGSSAGMLGTSLPLHTGYGLRLASRLVLDPRERPSVVVGRFIQGVRRAVTGRYRPAVLEGLGFAVRTLRPERLADYGRAVAGAGPGTDELFWHGVGRGLYFSPTQLYTSSGTGWPAFGAALSEAPDELARRNTVAGLAWALTLVNVRHPEVVERRLRVLEGRAWAAPWVAHGVAAALALWRIATGDDGTLEAFLAHRREGSGEAANGTWLGQVVDPVRAGLERLFDSPDPSALFLESFRYVPHEGIFGKVTGD